MKPISIDSSKITIHSTQWLNRLNQIIAKAPERADLTNEKLAEILDSSLPHH